MKAGRVRVAGLPGVSSRVAANDDCFPVGRASRSSVSIWPDPGRWCADSGADLCEVMSSVEDLWLRMARHPCIQCAVITDEKRSARVLIFRARSESANTEVQELMRLAASSATYQWSEDGARGNLVALIEWCADSLVIELVSARSWSQRPFGESTHWQMLALLQRMQGSGALQ